MSLIIQNRLKGTQNNSILSELLSNTIHFPIANIILELLKAGIVAHITELDMYIILASCLIQAYFLGKWNYQGKNRKLIGNLIAPALYTAIELPLEGLEFFDSYNHMLYWIIAISIGLLQQLQASSPQMLKTALKILENVIRTYIVLLMYAIYELTQPNSEPLSQFFNDESHVYFTAVLTLLGFVIGFAHVTADRYQNILQETASTMKTFSEWFLGGKLLSEAIEDNNSLKLKREERTVIFIDIRGFTAWSEKHTPEEVVSMLNNYFEISEDGWTEDNIIKIKYTGDEVMAICADKDIAVNDIRKINDKISKFLAQHNLNAGTGIHSGVMVEGIIGGKKVKAYDVIGDTVNTAKRICDKATDNQILASEYFLAGLNSMERTDNILEIEAKGKAEKIKVKRIK
ncbi:MAG: adenylate/guanylate cyclase domain-containing protein [Denitrovibrio sp.]|nr:MAG: adenylate/guanylate cyclase domain-containing protein [Denitrovibrio sp.]